MDISQLQRFDLTFPGHWIDDPDRDWAFETDHILRLAEDEFVKAVAAYALFEPTLTKEQADQYFTQSKYKRCLNGIYAVAFVNSLNAVAELLAELDKPSDSIEQLKKLYVQHFGHLKHIRDSAAHIEDRGRAVDRHGKPIPAHIIVLGAFNGRRFGFTSEDGKFNEIEISEATLLRAHDILQSIINAYRWIPMPDIELGLVEQRRQQLSDET